MVHFDHEHARRRLWQSPRWHHFRWENLLVAGFFCYLVVLVFQSGLTLHWHSKAESFADRSYSKGDLDFDSFGDHLLKNAAEITGKQVITPPGVAAFIAKYEQDRSFPSAGRR